MTASIKPPVNSGALYYTAYLLSADPLRFGSDMLFKVRCAYFTSGKRQKDKMFLTAQGESIRCFYAMENHKPLKWKKESEGRLCERAVPDGINGYCIESIDYAGTVNKKQYFDNQHTWLRSEYFDGFNQQPEFTLMPSVNQKPACLALYMGETRTPLLLESVPIPQNETLLETLAEKIQPQACAQTAAGLLYFCDSEKLAFWNEALAKAAAKTQKTPSAKNSRRKTSGFYFDMDALNQENTVFTVRHTQTAKEPVQQKKTPAQAIPVEAQPAAQPSVIKNEPQCAATPDAIPAEKTPKKRKVYDKAIQADKIISLSAKEKCLYFGALDENNKRTGQGRTQTMQGKTLYDGMYQNDMRSGFGAYYFKTGRISYLGNWKNNKRCGFGIAFRPTDGSVHVGLFEDDIPKGTAARFDKDGNLVYAGNWNGGEKTGAGITVRPDGTLLVSKWENGKQKNTASVLDAFGAVRYSGEVKNGVKEGRGTLFDSDGNILYTGSFKNDCYDGTGRLYLPSGDTVFGSFSGGQIHGKACKRTADGVLVYDGMWEHGLQSGDGTLYAPDGSHMRGSFASGKAQGVFSCFSKDKQLLYKGTLANGQYDGKGILFKDGKIVYDGMFARGEKSGMGRAFENGACTFMGTYEHNLPCGFGICRKDDKQIYSGFLKDGAYHGPGVLFKDGAPKYVGAFANGRPHGRVNLVRDGYVFAQCIYQHGLCVYMKTYTHDGSLLYEGSVKDGQKEGMGCSFTEFGEKSFEGIFKYNEPFKSMKVISKILEPIAYCEKLKNTEYESFRTAPPFAVEEPLCGGVYSGMLSRQGLPQGRGTMLYPDHRYTGMFKDGTAAGEGMIYFGDGRELQAQFINEDLQNAKQLVFASVTYRYILP